MTLKVYTFIGRLIRHIPDKHFPMIRYAGLFSNRWKKQYLAQALTALSLPESDNSSENTKPLWAQRQTERDNHLSGNAMIATKGWLSRVLIRTFMAETMKIDPNAPEAHKKPRSKQ